MRRWIAVAALAVGLPALGAPGPARAGDVTEGVTDPNKAGPLPYGWDGTRMRRQTSQSDGSANVFLSNLPAGVMNYVPMAMGPTTHRENNGGGPWVSTYVRDSTAAIALNGGTRMTVTIYAAVDTAAADSLGVIHWYALGIRTSLTAANDTGVVAPNLPIQSAQTIGGLSNVIAAYPWGSPLSGTGLVTSVNVATNLLPGEILVPVQTNANGIPGSRSVTFEVGGAYAVLTLRSFGHWVINPQASFIRLPIYKTKVRVDAVVTR